MRCTDTSTWQGGEDEDGEEHPEGRQRHKTDPAGQRQTKQAGQPADQAKAVRSAAKARVGPACSCAVGGGQLGQMDVTPAALYGSIAGC